MRKSTRKLRLLISAVRSQTATSPKWNTVVTKERQTDIKTDRDWESQRHTETETERHTERHRDRNRQIDEQRETERETERNRPRQKKTNRCQTYNDQFTSNKWCTQSGQETWDGGRGGWTYDDYPTSDEYSQDKTWAGAQTSTCNDQLGNDVHSQNRAGGKYRRIPINSKRVTNVNIVTVAINNSPVMS